MSCVARWRHPDRPPGSVPDRSVRAERGQRRCRGGAAGGRCAVGRLPTGRWPRSSVGADRLTAVRSPSLVPSARPGMESGATPARCVSSPASRALPASPRRGRPQCRPWLSVGQCVDGRPATGRSRQSRPAGGRRLDVGRSWHLCCGMAVGPASSRVPSRRPGYVYVQCPPAGLVGTIVAPAVACSPAAGQAGSGCACAPKPARRGRSPTSPSGA